MSTLEKSNTVADEINAIIKEIVDCIHETHPENWEAISRDVLWNKNLSNCHDIRVFSLFDKLKAMEENDLTTGMQMAKISAENSTEKKEE